MHHATKWFIVFVFKLSGMMHEARHLYLSLNFVLHFPFYGRKTGSTSFKTLTRNSKPTLTLKSLHTQQQLHFLHTIQDYFPSMHLLLDMHHATEWLIVFVFIISVLRGEFSR
jgi:hypothetical protein